MTPSLPGTHVIAAMWFLVCGLASPLAAQPTDTDLRDAAEAILSGDEFRHFPHFERRPPSAAQPLTPAIPPDSPPADSPARDPQPWWERLRRPTAGQPKAGGSPAETGSPATPAQSSDAPQSNRTPESAADEWTSPARSAPPPIRPLRPALRGSDGIERPVRHAPQAPRPASKSPEFDWQFGEFFVGLARVLGLTLHSLAYLVLAAIVLVILALVSRALAAVWRHRPGRLGTTADPATPLAHDRSPGETAADVFLRQALALAGDRQYRAAVGQLLLGAMSSIERRDWIRYRRGLTLRDYLRSVRSHPAQHAGLQQVVAVFEPVEYGRASATQADFERALQGYRTGFAADSTAVGASHAAPQ